MLFSGLVIFAINVGLSYQVLLPFYADIAVTFTSSSLSQYVYWKCRSASEEMCFLESLGSCWEPGDSTWLPALVDTFVSIILLSAKRDKFEAQVSISTIVLVQLLSVATKWWIFIELKYIVSGIMLVWVSLDVFVEYELKAQENIGKQLFEINIQLIGRQNMDETKLKYLLEKSNTLEQEFKNLNSSDWKNRFTKKITGIATSAVVAFTLVFIYSKFILPFATHTTPDETQIWQWLITVVVESCFNPIILLGIACLFGKLSELLVVLINAFLGVAQPNVDAFKYKVEVAFVILCIESGLMTIDERTRERCLKVVIAMTLFNVVSHSLSRVKNEILALANGGGQSNIKQYLRLIIVFIVLAIGPSFCVFRLCTRLQTSVWPFYNAIGNLELHIEMIVLVVEFLLIQASWWFAEQYHIINNVLFYVRIVGGISLLFASYMRCYYRLMSPFLTAFFWLRFALNLIWPGLGTVGICYIGWKQYKMRTELIDTVRNLPGCKPSPDNSECSVCYLCMCLGKQLPCGHIFHQECIERWFQVRTTCPFCNSPVLITQLRSQAYAPVPMQDISGTLEQWLGLGQTKQKKVKKS